jgi:iron(III) transport system ATP-binding protein
MLKINELVFKYDNSKEMIIDHLSFSLEHGKVLAIVGPSGGGKSTLLRLISGLEVPQEGSIQLHEKNITYMRPEKRGVGMLFQDYALFPHLTVEKNIIFGLEKKTKKEKQVILKEMLELVDLKGYEKRYPHELSGGQQQRVALARALAPKPHILLLDEPFSNLDTELLNEIRKKMFEIIANFGITTIMVTHNIEDATLYADTTLKLKNVFID